MSHLQPIPEIHFITLHPHKGQLKLILCAGNSLGECAVLQVHFSFISNHFCKGSFQKYFMVIRAFFLTIFRDYVTKFSNNFLEVHDPF
jgi:hypothetical protein